MHDNIIQFPGFARNSPEPVDEPQLTEPDSESPAMRSPENPLGPPEIRKSLSILDAALAGEMSFIIVGIRPTPTGADFFTDCLGNPDDLRNVEQHLPGTVAKLLHRKGVR